MATRFIYSASTDGYILSTSTVYATAQTGAGLSAVSNNLTFIGQGFSTPNYNLEEGFVEFDTAYPQTSGISSATLSAAGNNDNSTTDFTINARIYDWGGGTLTTASWRTVAQLSALTLVATLTTVGFVSGADVSPPSLNTFADVALLANINSSGFTRLVFSSSRQESSTVPTGLEEVALSSNTSTASPPVRLSIVDATTQSSQTISTGTTTFTPTKTGIHDIDLYAGGARPALSASQEGGGGGGVYVFYANNLTSLSNVTVAVAATQATANTSGNNTTWTAAPLARANGGVNMGSPALGIGFYYFLGGGPIAAQGGGGSRGGSGGSASGNPSATGVSGTIPSGAAGGAGGVGANGGGSGGAGGASAVAGSVGVTPGGGAGGGGNGADAGATGAAGRIVVYWYVVPTPIPDIIMAPLTHAR